MKDLTTMKRINNMCGVSSYNPIYEHTTKDLFYNILWGNLKEEEEPKQYNNIVDFITNESIHEKLTIAIVKKIASNPKHFCNVSCLEIVKGGYTDPILDDLKQEMFIALFEMSQAGNVTLINGNELEFSTYYDKNDNEKSYFLKLYRIVENFFYSQKKHIDNSAICLDSYNDDVTSTNKTSDYISFLYNSLVDNSLENIATREDIKQVFYIIKAKHAKHYSNICKVFELRYNGFTYDEIAFQCGLTKNKVRYCIDILRNVFIEYVGNVDIEREKKEVSTFGNGTITYYINRSTSATHEEFTRYIENIKPYEKPIIYPSSPLSCGFLDGHTKAQLEKLEKEREAEKYSGIFTHVIDTKHKKLCTINDKGQILFTYLISDRACKSLKKKLPTI